MTVLWWFVGTILIVLSFLLLVAGLKGKEGILRIGRPTDTEPDDWSAPCASQQTDEEREEGSNPQPRSANIPNIALGIAGMVVGVAAVIMFAV